MQLLQLLDAEDCQGGPTDGTATFKFDLTGLPLLRYHTYVFSVQVHSPEHASAWSQTSEPLELILPSFGSDDGPEAGLEDPRQGPSTAVALCIKVAGVGYDGLAADESLRRRFEGVVRRAVAEEAGEGVQAEDVTLELSRGSVVCAVTVAVPEGASAAAVQSNLRAFTTLNDRILRGLQAVEGMEQVSSDSVDVVVVAGPELAPAGGEASAEEAAAGTRGQRQGPLEAAVNCADHSDTSEWHVELSWAAHKMAGGEAFPSLSTLPVEFQVSYVILSERPCTGDGTDAGALGCQEKTTRFAGHACSLKDSSVAAERKRSAVCLEGWIEPRERRVVRILPRHRLPHIRCDVRVFVACRCPVITGPRWSEAIYSVDVLLPRLSLLPLPVPQQLGLAMDVGSSMDDSADQLSCILRVPDIAVDIAVVSADEPPAERNLMSIPNSDGSVESDPEAHYVLQYRLKSSSLSYFGASSVPHMEEHEWRTVPEAKILSGKGEGRMYLVAGLQEGLKDIAQSMQDKAIWATYRVASLRTSHFGYASAPTLVSLLPHPSKPEVQIEWIDAPCLDGARVRVFASCIASSQAYQLRFRRADVDPRDRGAWTVCEVGVVNSSTKTSDGGFLRVEAYAPIHDLCYHTAYCFSIRIATSATFSTWSEDSDPAMLSLEHHGVREGEGGLVVRLLGQDERHNYRCPVADISWPPLAFPQGIWGPKSISPSLSVTVEYRLRCRWHVSAHNDRAALRAALEELTREFRSAGSADNGAPIIVPDPDVGVVDRARRGYKEDCTKRSDPHHAFTPWQTVAVVLEKASDKAIGGRRCSCAMACLLQGCTYQVALDWRWKRHGDPFWMQAYEPLEFATLLPTPPSAPPRPLPVPPEVWDKIPELAQLGATPFALFQWPFQRRPASAVSLVPVGQKRDPLHLEALTYGSYAVQCRRGQSAEWLTCRSLFLSLHGKPVCLVPALPAQEEFDEARNVPLGAASEPRAVGTPCLPEGLGADELEFRTVRVGDCETSRSAVCVVAPPVPPVVEGLRLKLLPPHSALVLCVRFRGAEAVGQGSLPQEYQLRVEEEGGDSVLLPPVRLPLERTPEACQALRGTAGFLGEAAGPLERGVLGAEFSTVRGGGEDVQQLGPLEFEHVLALGALVYGRGYRVAVRWLSSWRVSQWSEAMAAPIRISAPRPPEDGGLLLRPAGLVELPADVAGAEFLPPIAAERLEISWSPFSQSLWGGSKMEYEIQSRCMVVDRPSAQELEEASHVEATPWEVAGVVLCEVDDATGLGVHPQDLGEGAAGARVFFTAQDLGLSRRYQFRLRARLLFNPASGHPEEWSEFVESAWHRTPVSLPEPRPPSEAAVPEPTPGQLLEDCTAYISFAELPVREEDRDGLPDVPAPYTLQFRGACQSSEADWQPVGVARMQDDCFLLSDARFEDHLTDGIVLRLWRLRPGALNEDADARQLPELASVPSRPLGVRCPRFAPAGPPTVRPVFGAPSSGGDLPLLLRFDWEVDANVPRLLQIDLHQIRYRMLPPRGSAEDAPPWSELAPIRQATARGAAAVVHRVPVCGPHFLLGADYEVALRVGTSLRWGRWSPPVPLSLQITPPTPPECAEVSARMETLEDGTVFFRLSWPAFRPHDLGSVITYRIRMMRRTRYPYVYRLSEEMVDRSRASLAAQEKRHTIGHLRRRVPRESDGAGGDAVEAGKASGEYSCDQEAWEDDELEFLHDVAADPFCTYRFWVDAKHDRCGELRRNDEAEDWSAALESELLETPPLPRNWFVPAQVPLEVVPGGSGGLRAPFPLALPEAACARLGLAQPSSRLLLLFSPWREDREAAKWPHRIEYTAYEPRANAARHPSAGADEDVDVHWHQPETVEYLDEDGTPAGTKGSGGATLALVQGFADSVWKQVERCSSLGHMVRVRVVREGGPEGMQLFSSPSVPMRLYMPAPSAAPTVAAWFAAEQPLAVLWWPCCQATAGEEDKNVDMSEHVHQIRMRRPLWQGGEAWREDAVRRTAAPVRLPAGSAAELFAFDHCALLDATGEHEGLPPHPLPRLPTGKPPDPGVLTYEFSVRIGDGYRWSAWSEPSELCCFASEPRVSGGAALDLRELAALLAPAEGTVCPAAAPDPEAELEDSLVYQEGTRELEPPQWVSIGPAPRPPEAFEKALGKLDAEANAQLSQFVACWPSLPAACCWRLDPDKEPALKEILATGQLPPLALPALRYRLNVWLNGSAPDAAPMTELPTGVHMQNQRMSIIRQISGQRSSRLSVLSQTGHEDIEPVLYRQYDVPDNPANGPDDKLERISWDIPGMLPDRRFHCTVEARFETLSAIWWWTPLLCSGEWAVGRVPPPSAPETLPICDLPTPQAAKLSQQLAIGATNLVVVRWPWTVRGSPMAALRSANYSLEFAVTDDRPSLVDATAQSRPVDGETTLGRPLGPWREARAMQLYFINFELGEVLQELPEEELGNPRWVPSLIVSGFLARSREDAGRRDSTAAGDQPPFVRLRWRYRALPEELSVIPTPLHFSAASAPVRTRVAPPTGAPEFRLERVPRHRNVAAWLKWSAWEGVVRHQFAFRILKKRGRPKRRAGSKDSNGSRASRAARGESKEQAEADAKSEGGDSDGEGPPAAQDPAFERITGWIEMPPVRDQIIRTVQERDDDNDEKDLSGFPGEELEAFGGGPGGLGGRLTEEELIAEYTRRPCGRLETSLDSGLPHSDWYQLLFGHFSYREDRFYDGRDAESDGSMDGSRPMSRASSASRARSVGSASQASARSSVRSGAAGSESSKKKKTRQRMTFGKVVEWRVRVSDGMHWSLWSPPSEPRGAVAPLPEFTTETRIRFSRHEPTIVQVAWGKCKLPPQYEDIESTIEYVLSVTTEPAVFGTKAQSVLMVGSKDFTEEKLHSRGLHMSEGGCGIVTRYKAEDVIQDQPDFSFDQFFTEGAEVRIVGKYSQNAASWINWEIAENEEKPDPVIGFSVIISGLRPESIHRVAVRARCAVSGLDEPDWQRGKVDNTHPVRWSDPNLSSPVLTPLGPPPLMVPQAVPVPSGKFGRFLHTPHLLLKCPIFKRKFRDEFDKDHPIRIDVKAADRVDDEFREVPLENSVYTILPEYGFCRFVYNLPFLHVSIRTRNVHMNNTSAPCPPVFTVPPLVLEDQRGPDVELVVAEDGNLFLKITWTTRCLPLQDVGMVQLGLRRHIVDSPIVDLQATDADGDAVLEEISPAALSAAGERRCPFACRRCWRPLAFEPPDVATLGPLGRGRLREARGHLQESCITFDEIPAYRSDEALQGLRAPHHVEMQARDQERHETEPPAMGWPPPHKKGRLEQVCHCRDRVVQKFLPVDGDRLCHGNTYRLRLRVRDALLWSPWTEFSPPVHVLLAAPRPALPLQDPRQPVPPPIVEVLLLQQDGRQLADLAFSEVRLRLRWPKFRGHMKELEYRVLMWTLSPEQQRRAAAGRQPGRTPDRSLPPIVGTEVFAFNLSGNLRTSAMQVDESGNARFAVEAEPGTAGPALVKPRAAGGSRPVVPGDAAVQQSDDLPQVIAHVKPNSSGPARATHAKLTPKVVVAEGGLQEGQSKAMTLEVSVIPLQRGHGYAFGVEAKHSQGAAGNLGEWSAPLFSKLCTFEAAPHGASEAPPVLPPSPPLYGGAGKYVLRQQGKCVYADRLEGPDGDLSASHLPERRPAGDDLRES
ncbi:unnamed protein product [Prorocentrum cordatum]|uniref:Uncharacterized protein n=1 Tax=Prorocentrum cordatum TaxID=2364126 RepID=A0ABN9PYB0_9DINO|nr:unnamed protein product [Polarella glacialis]